MTLLRILTLASCLFAVTTCKKPNSAGVKDYKNDRELLGKRLVVAKKGLLTKGEGYQAIDGFVRSRLEAKIPLILNSKLWDELPLLVEDEQHNAKLQEYDLEMTFGADNGEKHTLKWTIPALSAFAAPIPTKYLLVAMQEGFFVSDHLPPEVLADQAKEASEAKPSTLDRREIRVMKLGATPNEMSFIDTGIFRPSETAPTLEKDPIFNEPMPKNYIATPVLELVNKSGAAIVNPLELGRGDLFLSANMQRADGASFGIWTGPDLMVADIAKRNFKVLSLGLRNLDTIAELNQIQRLIEAGKSLKILSSRISKGKLVPAFIGEKLVLGGFDSVTRSAVPTSITDYYNKSNMKPEPIKIQSEPEPEVKGVQVGFDTWHLEQFAGGFKWHVTVIYRRDKTDHGFTATVTRISITRAGTEGDTHENGFVTYWPESLSLSHPTATIYDANGKSSFMTTDFITAGWIGTTVKFTRHRTGNFLCHIEAHVPGGLLSAPIDFAKDATCSPCGDKNVGKGCNAVP